MVSKDLFNNTKKRPVILTFLRYYLPGSKSGGPVRTIANMVEHLSESFEFRIITSDRDMTDNAPYENVVIDSWNRVGKALVYYSSPSDNTLYHFINLLRITPHDIVYLNSFFDSKYTQLPLLARLLRLVPNKPCLLAPRGEFSEGAVILKSWKKRPYIKTTRLFGLYNNLFWQASSEYEMQDIKKNMGKVACNIKIAKDLPPKVLFESRAELPSTKSDTSLRVVFLSRISPMKNLDYAIKVLSQTSNPVKFSIYGVVDDQVYWSKCLELIGQVSSNISIEYMGHIDHGNVIDALSAHDLFFFPTRGENYGHVIFEALAAGLPVLISDQTPWRNLEEAGVGWDLPLNAMDSFVEAIEKQTTLSIEERNAQRKRAKKYASIIAMDEEAVLKNLRLFEEAMEMRDN